MCNEGFEGDNCKIALCPGTPVCGGRGACNNTDGTCSCRQGFTGKACELEACPKNCNGKGSCGTDGKCACFAGYTGDDCGTRFVVHGEVLDGDKVRCYHGYGGPDCNVRECRNNCSSRGICVEGTCYCKPSWTGDRSAHTRSKPFFDSTFAVARACRATGTCFLACVASVPILTLAHRLASRSAHAFTMHFAALGTRLQVTRFSFPAYLAFALPVLHALATIGTRLRALMMGIEYRAVFAGVAIRACTFSFHALAMTSTQVLANRDAAVRTHPQSFARAGAISTASSVTAAIGRAGFLHASRASPTLSRERRVDFDVVAFAFLRRYVARTVYDEADTARRSFKAWITRAFPAWCTSTMRHTIPRTNTQTARYSGPALGAHASFVFADTTVLADRVALFDITSRPLPVRVAMTRIRTV